MGVHTEHRHGTRHRQQGRAQDIKAVDFGRAYRADSNAGGATVDAPPKRAVASFTL